MKFLKNFSVFFAVLVTVFLIHTDSNLWIAYPDRMVLKDKATPLQRVCWSAALAAVYSLAGAVLLRIADKRDKSDLPDHD